MKYEGYSRDEVQDIERRKYEVAAAEAQDRARREEVIYCVACQMHHRRPVAVAINDACRMTARVAPPEGLYSREETT